jgi:acyl carrier protein
MVLTSRSGPAADGVAGLAAQVAGRGAGVRVVACDAADRGSVAGLVGALGGSLGLVVHAAGVVDDGVIGSLSADRVDAVMRAKADGAWHLHELTRDLGLSGFVLFSSAAAAFGGAGQGNYAAGNAFLDGLAAARRAEGLPAVSLAWGLWAGASGVSGHLGEADRARLARSGMGSLSAAEGLALFDAALFDTTVAGQDPVVVPMHLESTRADPAQMPALLRGLVRPRPRRAPGASQPGSAVAALRERLAGAPEAERDAIVLDLVMPEAAAVLGYGSADQVEAGREFQELGFDSLTAIELRNRLASATGLRLSATLIFDHPTPVALAAHLGREIVRDAVPPGPRAAGETSPGTRALEDIGRLEQILPDLARDDGARTGLTRRIRALLRVLESDDGTTGNNDLETATMENIFELLDTELGDS